MDLIPINGIGVHIGGKWGSGNSFAIGNKLNESPAHLKIGYYSYVENKFYEGNFDLPYKKIENYFEETYIDPITKKSYLKYNYLCVGITFGGKIILWISGNDYQKEIGCFQSMETHYDKFSDVFNDERSQNEVYIGWYENFDIDLKQMIKAQSLPFKIWDFYRQQYNLKYTISKNFLSMQVKTINMEKQSYFNGSNTDLESSAIPYNIQLKWRENDILYEARIVFSENLELYNSIYKSEKILNFPANYGEDHVFNDFKFFNKESPVEVLIEINDQNSDIKVFLKQGQRQYLMKNYILKIFKKSV